LSKLARGAVYADLSTNSPTVIRQIGLAFKERGIEVLDAPVSGGISGARDATLAVMVGGSRAAFERIKPALDAIGDKVSYLGENGAGAVAKLVHNMITLCSTQLLAEAFTMGIKAGVGPEALLKVVQDGAYGQGMLLKGTMPRMVFRGNFDRVTFALRLAKKDLGLATEIGRELNVPMPIAALVEQDLLSAIANGLGEKDMTAAVTVQENRANVKIRT
jgi:3-hydroxyisobutyrate dehydrogenase